MKLFYIAILLILIGILSSCGSKPDQTPKPDNMIAQDTLVMMFYDIHLIDASLTTNVVDPRGVYSRYNLYQSMFAKYNRNEDDFNETIRYYVLNDIEVLDEIYDKVLAQLNKEQGELTQKLQEDI
jgi:hypothetical protein